MGWRGTLIIAAIALLVLALIGARSAILSVYHGSSAKKSIADTGAVAVRNPAEKDILITGATSCHPVPIPGEHCPNAASLTDIVALDQALDACARNIFRRASSTDGGFGYEAPASAVSEPQVACIRARISPKITIERVPAFPLPISPAVQSKATVSQ